MSSSQGTSRVRGRGTRPASIALFGLFGSGNSGNDGSLEAMLTIVRRARPDAELLCICGDPANVERDFRIRAVPMEMDGPRNPVLRKLANLLRAIRLLRRCDLLIVPGTGVLDDFGTGPTGLPLALFNWCLAARLRRAAIAFVSIGAGPIQHPASRWLMKTALGMAGYRSYRDGISKDFLKSIGFPAHEDPVYPDLAFMLPGPASTLPMTRGDGPATVGLGVMTYQGWHNDPVEGAAIYGDYLRKLTDFAQWLLERGHRVRLLMGDGTDRRASEDLQLNLLHRGVSIAPERLQVASCRTLHDLMEEIAQTDIVVATRFHNVVCALKLGRPVVSIGYAEKNDALMADAGLGEFCQAIEALDVDLLIRQFTELESEIQLWHRRLGETNYRYRSRLRDQQDMLSRLLLEPRTRIGQRHESLSVPARQKDGG